MLRGGCKHCGRKSTGRAVSGGKWRTSVRGPVSGQSWPLPGRMAGQILWDPCRDEGQPSKYVLSSFKESLPFMFSNSSSCHLSDIDCCGNCAKRFIDMTSCASHCEVDTSRTPFVQMLKQVRRKQINCAKSPGWSVEDPGIKARPKSLPVPPPSGKEKTCSKEKTDETQDNHKASSFSVCT